MAGAELFELFRQRAEQAGAHVERLPGPREACAYVCRMVAERKLAPVLVANGPLLGEMHLVAALAGQGTEVLLDTAQGAEQAALGVTEADLGVAETGSLYQDATSLVLRLASMLPPVHVAVLPADRIVGTLEEALPYILGRGQPPAYAAFITGPSRTADIERVLTIGVHGPAELHILCIDRPQAAQRAASA
ncbi:MAG: lactate utilization protein [Bacillota bacterium]|nr:lactate utilization protein [Bacillota bacterium]